MSNVHVVVVKVASRGDFDLALPVPLGTEVSAQTIAASGTSAQSTITAPSSNARKYVWEVTTSTADVYVKVGANPTAASNTGFRIPAASTRWIGCSADGEKIAVIEA